MPFCRALAIHVLHAVRSPLDYSSVKIFNQLLQNILKFCNIHTFKTILRDYLVKNAFYSIEEYLYAGHNNVDI